MATGTLGVGTQIWCLVNRHIRIIEVWIIDAVLYSVAPTNPHLKPTMLTVLCLMSQPALFLVVYLKQDGPSGLSLD